MDKLTIHPATRKLLEAYLKRPAHALLLTGEEGVGLGAIAHALAEKLSEQQSTITTIVPEKGTIPIEQVRGLYAQTRSSQAGKRVIVIDDADAMSQDAQNALLKLLEEPTKNVYFILTSHNSSRLLMTIRSRTQQLGVLLIDEATSKTLLDTYTLTPTERAQSLFLAAGRPAELTRLASNPDYFASTTAVVTDARTFLQADSYTRLTIIKSYTDRVAAQRFLGMAARLLTFTLLRQKNFSSADGMAVLDEAMKRIDANAHVRTQLMWLVTKLP